MKSRKPAPKPVPKAPKPSDKSGKKHRGMAKK